MLQPVEGFSKLSKREKIDFIVSHYFSSSSGIREKLRSFSYSDKEDQKTFDEFSENTISNFHFPFGVVPNVIINRKLYCIPMVVEESSVVAASSRSVKFWSTRGGFHAKVKGTRKIGQIHFFWHGRTGKLFSFFNSNKRSVNFRDR